MNIELYYLREVESVTVVEYIEILRHTSESSVAVHDVSLCLNEGYQVDGHPWQFI